LTATGKLQIQIFPYSSGWIESTYSGFLKTMRAFEVTDPRPLRWQYFNRTSTGRKHKILATAYPYCLRL